MVTEKIYAGRDRSRLYELVPPIVCLVLLAGIYLVSKCSKNEPVPPPEGHVEVCEPAVCPPPTKEECPESIHHTTYLCQEYQCRRFHDDHVEGAVGEPSGTIICKNWLVWCGED